MPGREIDPEALTRERVRDMTDAEVKAVMESIREQGPEHIVRLTKTKGGRELLSRSSAILDREIAEEDAAVMRPVDEAIEALDPDALTAALDRLFLHVRVLGRDGRDLRGNVVGRTDVP